MVLSLTLLMLSAAPDAGAADAGAVDGGSAVAAATAGWTLSSKLGPGLPAREALIADLIRPGSDAGVGETPLTRAEAEAMLDDPRAQKVYGEKTVSIVAPSMLARHRQEHLDLMKRFLQPEFVAAGREFMKKHEAVLEAVEKKNKVDREHIIGILMWESKLGTITGDWVAFNALASQAFFADEANTFALAQVGEKGTIDEAAQARRVEKIRSRGRKNLLTLARQCKTKGIDIFTMKGSWAGALGFPQFMPASLRWADDGDGDGKIDLFNMPDAIASVGRYLMAAGYSRSPREAVYDYNHEEAYVQGVLAFAEALKATPDAGAPPAEKPKKQKK